MSISVSPSLASLHAEKADISRGSVIERIMFRASNCHGGWRERCIVEQWVEEKKLARGQWIRVFIFSSRYE